MRRKEDHGIKNRGDWRRERRQLWWARHQALAGSLIGSAMLLGVVIIISFDRPQMAALRQTLWFAGSAFLAVALEVATVMILALLCMGLAVITIESFISSKRGHDEETDEKKSA